MEAIVPLLARSVSKDVAIVSTPGCWVGGKRVLTCDSEKDKDEAEADDW